MPHAVRAFLELSPLISKCYRLRVITYTWYLAYQVEVFGFYRNEHTTWNIHMMCAVGYSSLNPQYPALRSFNRLGQWISIPGHGRPTQFVTRQRLHVTGSVHACSKLLLWLTMAIDGHGWQCIVFDNAYRSQLSQVYYCRRQYLSIDTFHNPLSRTIYIDRFTHKR